MSRFIFVFAAIAATIPGVALSLSGVHIHSVVAALLYGLAIIGASFLLS